MKIKFLVVGLMIGLLASSANGRVDTVRIGRNHTRIINRNTGMITLRISQGENYFDPISNTYKKWVNLLSHNPGKKEWTHNKGRNFKADSNMVINLSIGERFITTKPLNTLTPKPQGEQEGETIYWRNFKVQADWKVEQMPEGFRGTVIMRRNSPLVFQFEHTFSGIPIEVQGAIYMDGMRIHKPIAWDANGLSIPVTMELSDPVDGFYTVTYAVDPSGGGFAFPYYLDPTVTIDRAQDIRDTQIANVVADVNLSGNAFMYLGASAGEIDRLIISINLADSIPALATVTSGRLILYIGGVGGSPDATTRMYRMTPDSGHFVPSYPDWNHSDHGATDLWNTAGLGSGVDYLAVHYDEIESKLVTTELDTFDLTAWSREIVSGDSVNYGLHFRSVTESGSNRFYYRTMERSIVAQRPKVEIEYTLPEPPAATKPGIQKEVDVGQINKKVDLGQISKDISP